MVYLNGQFLAPDGVLASSNNDYYFKKGRLHFEFITKCGDHIAVIRTFLGIMWSRRYYRIDDYSKVPEDTPLILCGDGKVVAVGILTDAERKAAKLKAAERSDDQHLVA